MTNLTTVSNSLPDFRALIIGYWLVDRIVERGEFARDSEPFLVWEQLCGYARHLAGGQRGFRGVERVSIKAQQSKIDISASRADQILGDQRTYGIWGLYSSPARESGLINRQRPWSIPAVDELVRNVYLPELESAWDRDARALLRTIGEGDVVRPSQDRWHSRLRSIVKCIERRPTVAERNLFDQTLVRGGSSEKALAGVQGLAADLVIEHKEHSLGDRASVAGLARIARNEDHPSAGPLADRLHDIATCESVIAPAASVFGFLVQQDGRRLRDVAMEIDNHWDGTRPEIDQAAVQRIDLLMRSEASDNGRWVHIAKALRSRSLIPALELLVEQNAATMQARGLSAPWLAVESGRISVKYRDEQAYLPDAEELPGWWRNPYFLPTLVSIARQVHAR